MGEGGGGNMIFDKKTKMIVMSSVSSGGEGSGECGA